MDIAIKLWQSELKPTEVIIVGRLKMRILRNGLWVCLILAALILSGCADALLKGELFEKRYDDGQVSRFKIDQREGWSAWDRFSPTKPDETSVFLITEKTF